MPLFYGMLLGMTVLAFLLSFFLPTGPVGSFVLGLLMLLPMYLLYRELRYPPIRPRRTGRPGRDRGKVLPFPDSDRKTHPMD